MPIKAENVDQYLADGCGRCEFGGTPQCKVHSWDDELNQLRSILLESDLIEEIKWGAPCYTSEGKNILMLSALRESVVISFFRGAELKDPENVLSKPGKNSRFARYMKIKDVQSIPQLKSIILSYIKEAITLEKTGSRKPGDDQTLEYPVELIQAFESNPEFKEAFSKLTPGRQRGYLLHFSSAKQSQTRTNRIEKFKPRIFDGLGWNEWKG